MVYKGVQLLPRDNVDHQYKCRFLLERLQIENLSREFQIENKIFDIAQKHCRNPLIVSLVLSMR